MLNRLFIAIGVLVILAIGAAFVVPGFIQWGDYRVKLESMASDAFGTEVAIGGDIHLTLLPQPKIEFTDVRVGPEDAPAMQVARVAAEFALTDFLRDQYHVTRLELDQPVINLAIDTDGGFTTRLALQADATQSNVSIANADVVGGTVRLADARSGRSYAGENINGQLRLDALEGPFSFQGTATVDGSALGVRVATGKFDTTGASTLSLYVKADDASFTLESNGNVQLGPAPAFTGDLTYRQPPPAQTSAVLADAGRGDFVLQGKIEANDAHLALTELTATPDENRSSNRLTGAGEITLGAAMAFDATLSGGLIALPPRDATKETAEQPYELVRLLAETPLPPIPHLPGRIRLELGELNLRSASLRGLKLDASTDAQSWNIKDFVATLPGETSIGVGGNLSVVDGHPVFVGKLSVDSGRLDMLAQLWRRAPAGNPLFNMSGSLKADMALSSDTLSLSAGTLVVDGINQGFDAAIGFGPMRTLAVDAHFTTLGPEESAAIGALLPDFSSDDGFGVTFPKGEVKLSASKAVLFGLDGTELAADATWEGGVLEISRLAAADLGGAQFDGRLTAFGTLAKPEVSGTAQVRIEDGAAALTAILASIHAPSPIEAFLRRSLPADMKLQLNAPAADGGQKLTMAGRLGTANATLEARLTAGVANAFSAPLAASLDLVSESPALMTAQLGLGGKSLFDERSALHLALSLDGVPSNSYETHVALEGGQDHIRFDGNVVPGDFTAISGDGDIDVAVSDPSALAETLGAGGVFLPALSGTARLRFTGADKLALSDIAAAGLTGELGLVRDGDHAMVSGSLALPTLDTRALLPLLTGAAGTVSGTNGPWPEGPIDIGSAPRMSEGRIDVALGALTADGSDLLTGAQFGFDWDETSVHLRHLSGNIGKGTANFDVTVCCSNPALADKRISGRAALNGVSVDAIAPAQIAKGLDGTLDGAAEFNGTGASLVDAIAAMTGSGSYTINGFSAARFDPHAFDRLGALTGVFDMKPEALTATVMKALQAGPFTAPSATGSFTIAGGMLRSPNLAIEGDGARIFGGANVSLGDLRLNARYAMSPTDTVNADGALETTTAEVASVISGPLWAPEVSYDLGGLVAGMQRKASEVELARLEKLQAEDEARRQAAAAEQARLAEEQAAADAAKKAADEAAARKAVEAAAAQKAADDAAAKKAAEQAAQPMDLGI